MKITDDEMCKASLVLKQIMILQLKWTDWQQIEQSDNWTRAYPRPKFSLFFEVGYSDIFFVNYSMQTLIFPRNYNVCRKLWLTA